MTKQSPAGDAPGSGTDSLETGEAAADSSASQAFRDAVLRLGEIREYIAFYLLTQADIVKLAIRNGLVYAALMLVGVLAAAAVVVVSVTLLLLGLAGMLADAMGAKFWLGALIVGVVVLTGIAIAVRIGLSMVTGTFRKLTVEKYESRKREQRDQFGHDVEQRGKHAEP